MMKKTSKLMSLVIAGAMVLSMTACGGNTAETTAAATQAQETAADTAAQAEETTAGTEDGTAAQAEGTTYKIGVLQLVQHTALDAANEGFIAALDDAGIAYEVDQQNASAGKGARGDFGPFMAPQASAKVMYDEAFVRELEQLCEEADFPMGTEGEKEKELDHGTLVPLFFINQYYRDYKLVRIGGSAV